jgi:hypothetical protein
MVDNHVHAMEHVMFVTHGGEFGVVQLYHPC